MREWTQARLEGLISSRVEEGLNLEYKRADALGDSDGKKKEITRDISAFANSSGGIVIYGIAEYGDKEKCHFPERLDPVRRGGYSREWLEQIVQSIQPRIDGCVIYPVPINGGEDLVCYVVEVPKSNTAHQARDLRYHKRHNFNVLQMEDYEIRDVMNRRGHPVLEAEMFFNSNVGKPREGILLFKLRNIGRTMAQHVMVDLLLPLSMGEGYDIEGVIVFEAPTGEAGYKLRLVPPLNQPPMFPGSDLTFRRKVEMNGGMPMRGDGTLYASISSVHVKIFADEMPVIRGTLLPNEVMKGWMPIASQDQASACVGW